MWASKAARIGYRWKVGNGKKIKFWEDVLVGNISLAILFWDLYYIVNEKNMTIVELWDVTNLKCTFRRCVDNRKMQVWLEIVEIAKTLELVDEDDSLVWQYTSNGVYNVQSLYNIVNFRGIIPVYLPAVWKLNDPPRLHVFLWLLSKNRVLTRDNLAKRQFVNDKTCLFCSEEDTVFHLFFGCVVSARMWNELSEVVGFKLDPNFENVAKLWLSQKKNT
uniref:Reverse transcriptase zinc-binding domain-containing protein n=1 Tax=Arundo donax TaxID=35708 RepID=A0A0A8Y3J5_ARUDO